MNPSRARLQRTFALGAAMIALGCTGSDRSAGPEIDSDGAAETTTGATRVRLTDAPFPYDRIARVDLYIVSISGSVSPDTSAANANFVEMATPKRRINILSLQNGETELLGSAQLPMGNITAMRMVIDTDSSSITLNDGRVLRGNTTPGIQWQSSAGRPTLNALIHEQILVPSTGGVAVIDFDVGRSFAPVQELDEDSTDSSFIFMPTFHAADSTRTGTISGTVLANSGSGAPVKNASLRLYLGDPGQPENTWIALSTARSDANGAFKFSYVTRAAFWSEFGPSGRAYIVAADPPSGSGLGRVLVRNVAVDAGKVTSLGTLVLP